MKTLAIIVNYHSAGLCADAARSITKSDSLGPIQVVVVDNSDDCAEFNRLVSAMPENVHVMADAEALIAGWHETAPITAGCLANRSRMRRGRSPMKVQVDLNGAHSWVLECAACAERIGGSGENETGPIQFPFRGKR